MQLHVLEQRRLLSSSLSNGVLSIIGTDSSETIEISLNGSAIRVNQTSNPAANFPLNAVNRIFIDAKGGSDRVTISTAISKPASVLGQSGNDTLTGGNGPDTMDGGSGGDVLSGRAGADSLRGGASNDAIVGGSGNDRFDGGSGADFIDGQGGGDTVIFARSTPVNAFIEIGANSSGNPTIGGQNTTDGDTFNSIERLNGGSGNDSLSIRVNDIGLVLPPNVKVGDFELNGGDGNDTFESLNAGFTNRNIGTLVMRGGNGNDTLRFYELQDLKGTYLGEGGNDLFRHSGENVVAGVDGGSGFDTEVASVIGPPFVTVSPGVEKFEDTGQSVVNVIGNELDNTIILNGIGTIDGRGGDDFLINNGDGPTEFAGGEGNDTMTSGASSDGMAGGPGNDTYVFRDVVPANNEPLDEDFIDELPGGGTDTLNFSALTTALNVDLQPDDTRVATHLNRVVRVTTLANAANFENVRGGAGNDFIFGNTRGNKLFGNGGKDSLFGVGGNDILEGGGGDDSLLGGNGDDQLFGGSGADRLFGEGGDDFLSDRDGTRDTLDGGSGDDEARRDAIDAVFNVES